MGLFDKMPEAAPLDTMCRNVFVLYAQLAYLSPGG